MSIINNFSILLVDNLDHCDTKAFSDLFIKHSLVDLISQTADFYENFRAKKLLE